MESDIKTIEVGNIKFTDEEMAMITRALISDDDRLFSLPVENALHISLLALVDYINNINPDTHSEFSFRNVAKAMKGKKDYAFIAGIVCLYCELRYRATRGHNEEMAKLYLEEHDSILKSSLRSMKKDEKTIFLGVLTA